MLRKVLIAAALIGASGAAHADSNTSCRRTLMGGMDCTTTSSQHPADAANQSMQNGMNSLAAAIIARGERKRAEKEAAATQVTAPVPLVDFASGNGFLAGCKSPASALNSGLCWGYLEGFMRREFLPGDSKLICLSDGIQKRQLYDAIIQYIERHPGERHWSVAALTANALYDAFPCAAPVSNPVVQPTPGAKP